MGEDETVDFESLKHTLVFWNMDDYPTPIDTTDDLSPIFGDILKAFDLMGFHHGFLFVNLYSEQHNYDKKRVDVIHQYLPDDGESYSAAVYRVPDMTLEIIHMATWFGPGPVNVFVIAKPKRELVRVLHCLKSRHHNVVLVEPPPDEECLFSVDYLLNNARLLGGGKPRHKPVHSRHTFDYDMDLERYDEIKEDLSKTVDFSERIPTVKGVKTAVFWDAEDCPFPLSFTPDQIYRSIASALKQRNFSDNITIWAYLDNDKKGSCWRRDALLSGKKTSWDSRIYFLPGGDKASRRIRMLNDITLWIRDSPDMNKTYEASLVLFSDQFKDVYYTDMLQNLGNMHYYVLLVTPTLDINNPESPEWPGLLIDRGAYFFAKKPMQIISEGPSPAQHDADADADAAAQVETPERLPIISDMDSYLCRFGVPTTESSEDEDMLDSHGGQRSEEPCPEKHKADAAEEETPPPVYRFDPITLMYKLESLFLEEHEAEEETPEKLATHSCRYRWDPISLKMNKLESSEWPGRQIDGGSGWGDSKLPFPKKSKADAADEVVGTS